MLTEGEEENEEIHHSPGARGSVVVRGFGGCWPGKYAPRRAAELHVNFDHGCSGEREKSDYEARGHETRLVFVAARITRARAPPDSFSRHNESNFFSLSTCQNPKCLYAKITGSTFLLLEAESIIYQATIKKSKCLKGCISLGSAPRFTRFACFKS
ncbi:hypothetical protein DBV15_05908 [Temnothorax longispinosus]|uniref:Uncharacterized protein n=1 Tax=Temnothorax longispinosus TaxID=300112 RepID=A0A4S2KI41_9HYME|nr:hypothetical protein DBV15_05908 [Temnothorax longispinosus]